LQLTALIMFTPTSDDAKLTALPSAIKMQTTAMRHVAIRISLRGLLFPPISTEDAPAICRRVVDHLKLA
jgi:hypothetical protein